MNNSNREKVLLIAALSLLGIFGLWLLWSSLGGAAGRRAARDKLQTDVNKLLEEQLKESVHARKLADYQRRSLPSDENAVLSIYQNWLNGTVAAAGLEDCRIDYDGSGIGKNADAAYARLSFTVRAYGSLDDVTRFLHAFHKADYLHQIRTMTLDPLKDPRQLNVTISIEALSLKNAAQAEALPSDELAHYAEHGVDEYIRSIAGRSVFTPHVKPAPPYVRPTDPPDPPQPPAFDERPYTVCGGITQVDGEWEALVEFRIQGKKQWLKEGEEFQFGPATCRVHRIEPKMLVIEVSGGYYGVSLGKSFAHLSVVEP